MSQKRKVAPRRIEDIDEEYSEDKASEAKINIVVGTPNVGGIETQKVGEVREVDDQIPFELSIENPRVPSQEALHSARITLKKGIEQKVIEETVNNALTPHKTGHKSDLPVFQRLYAIHEDKMVEKILSDPEILKQYGGEDAPKKATTTSSPNVPRVYGLAKIRAAEKAGKVEIVATEAKKQSQPRINEFSRILADSLAVTPDRRAFKEGYIIEPKEKRLESLSTQRIEEVETQEMKECTFHPKINEYHPHSPSNTVSPSTPTGITPRSFPSPSSSSSSSTSSSSSPSSSYTTPSSSSTSPSPSTPQGQVNSDGNNTGGVSASTPKSEGSDGDTARNLTQTTPGGTRHLELYNRAKIYEERKKALKEEYEKKEGEKNNNYTPTLEARTETEGFLPKGSSFDKRLERYLEKRKETKTPEEKKDGFLPDINEGVLIPTTDYETYVNSTWGVKKHLDRERKVRDKKEQIKPLFDPSRKYPPPPTLFHEFNITTRASPGRTALQALKNYEAE